MKVESLQLKPQFMLQMFKFLIPLRGIVVSFYLIQFLVLASYDLKKMIIDVYSCRKPCKVGIKYLEDGTKVRVARGIGASGSIIPRPEILKIRTTPRPTVGT